MIAAIWLLSAAYSAWRIYPTVTLIEERLLALLMAIGLGPFLAVPLLLGRFIAVGMGR